MLSRLAVLAGAAALAACDQKPSAEKMGRQIDRGLQKAEEQVDRIVEQAKPRLEQAEKALREKTTTAAEAVDDITLATRVKTALIADPGIKARGVNVEAKDGTVSLFGKAESEEQRERAEKATAAVTGVKSVRNHLVVPGS